MEAEAVPLVFFYTGLALSFKVPENVLFLSVIVYNTLTSRGLCLFALLLELDKKIDITHVC